CCSYATSSTFIF
nr:immunoglobulin light chain junction region [Macaca mulatta]MPO04667.1 immunoglobulin light chain junction region [Macaca mulatta]MPO05712.1 immunoglobulin light chain junction region [Macaca mulatta]MPO08156.1 immunoglobulin light chain junction region [Macaca mulatta]MPO12686.1 immunoglobulin light chain junction region [Macaca mulatta]